MAAGRVPAFDRPAVPVDAAGARHNRVYGRRWQAASVFRRLERRLGAATAAVTEVYQPTAILLTVGGHHIMLLAARGSTPHPEGRSWEAAEASGRADVAPTGGVGFAP